MGLRYFELVGQADRLKCELSRNSGELNLILIKLNENLINLKKLMSWWLMNNFIEALDASIKTKNWYSVLFISLTLPDICGKIDRPDLKSSKLRTIEWYNKYLLPAYTSFIGPSKTKHVFLSGSDFYALRCACLHEGSNDISEQKARETLQSFIFIQPMDSSLYVHCNQINNSLQLQVDQFGSDVLFAVKCWMKDISSDQNKISKIESMLFIKMIDPSKGFSI